jgi:hypothetical protein
VNSRAWRCLPIDTDVEYSNEVVAYRTAADAAKALSQWHMAAATGPRTPVRSRVSGTPPFLVRVSINELNAAGLPVRANAVTAVTGRRLASTT